MPNSDLRLPLRAVAADEGTEIFLVDAGFRRLASAVGELRAEVEPGLYKLRFRSGDTMADQLVEVSPELPPGEDEILVRGEPLRFASALPMPDTRTSHEYHQAAWSHAWDAPDLGFGTGSLLFVLARDADRRPDERAHHRPWQGLSLRDLDGRVLLDFAQAPRRDERFAYASANVELAPGTYVLRVETELDGVLEMPVVTCAGWQTQVALRSRTLSRPGPAFREETRERGRSVRRADLSGATVLMGRPGYRADPSGGQDRLTELARIGLVQGRSTLRPDDLRSLLWAKYENPMFGLYGAHLLLQGGEPDIDLLHTVVGNLETLVGGHPDVAALRLALARHDGEALPDGLRFETPPMLVRGWRQVVEASQDWPELVPAGSFAARVATSLVSGPHWLIWRRTPELARALRAGERGEVRASAEPVIAGVIESIQPKAHVLANFGQALSLGLDPLEIDFAFSLPSAGDRTAELVDRIAELMPALAERPTRKLTPMQQAVLHELAAAASLPAAERVARVAKNLGLPPAVLGEAVEGLAGSVDSGE